jgi:VTC domain
MYEIIVLESSHSNDLRFTVDHNVRLYDEMRYEPTGNSWCIPDDALASAKHVVLPYAIFEVKLAGSEMPESINNLVESGRAGCRGL